MKWRGRTDDKGDGAEEGVQQVQPPTDPLLQYGRHLTDEPVEGPIRRRRQTGALCAYRHRPGWATPQEVAELRQALRDFPRQSGALMPTFGVSAWGPFRDPIAAVTKSK